MRTFTSRRLAYLSRDTRWHRSITGGAFTFFLALTSLAGCVALPSLENRVSSIADLATGGTRLARGNAAEIAAHPGKSGVYTLSDGCNAFAARALLAQSAERTLDVQYYMKGTLLFAALRRAADRGVRVRLLLDDNNTTGLDTILTALDAHPVVEVRLFNPFAIRSMQVLGYLTDFKRANRRMQQVVYRRQSSDDCRRPQCWR